MHRFPYRWLLLVAILLLNPSINAQQRYASWLPNEDAVAWFEAGALMRFIDGRDAPNYAPIAGDPSLNVGDYGEDILPGWKVEGGHWLKFGFGIQAGFWTVGTEDTFGINEYTRTSSSNSSVNGSRHRNRFRRLCCGRCRCYSSC
ncbi:MAG: hypothetical protein R3C05_12125 [Pirellulaceae bacterium]